MPYRFGLVWPIVYALWIAAVVALVWSARRTRDTRTTLAIAGTLAAATAVPIAVTALTYDRLGFAWQGRYELPLLFAVPLLAAEITRGVLPRIGRSADWVVGTAGLALCLSVACLAVREDVPRLLVATAVVAAATGWWGAWWVLRSSVAPARPAHVAGHGEAVSPLATVDRAAKR